MNSKKAATSWEHLRPPHVELAPLAEEPAELHLYPEYIIGELMKRGMGKIEADRALAHDDKVDFVFTPAKGGGPEVVGSLGIGYFRSALARFGPRCHCRDILYAGHTLFTCDFVRDGALKLHHFSMFVCNFQNCGFWLRLYLYQISDNDRPVFEPRQ
jgi:hypothetical protein